MHDIPSDRPPGLTARIPFCIILGLVLVLSLAAATAAGAAEKSHLVLIIESYHPSLDWTRLCEEGIRQTLGENYRLKTFYMDTKRIPENEFGKRAQEAWDVYEQIQPDLVMLGDDNALRLLGQHLAATRTPVVFFGINNNPRNYFHDMPPNITGLLERTPLIPWLRYLHEVMPRAQRALVLMDSSISTASIINVTFQDRAAISVSGMLVEYRIVTDWAQWKNIVRNPEGNDLIVSPTFHAVKDEKGVNVPIPELIQWTSANSPVPIFTNQDYTVYDEGAAGAYTLDALSHGRQAAEMVLAILDEGRQASTLKINTDKNGTYVFNKQQLERFGISLPEHILQKTRWQ